MKLSTLILAGLILFSACSSLPTPTQEIILSTSTPTSKEMKPCVPENWVIAITSAKQTELGDGTKIVFVELGIENNDLLWGKVSGPKIPDNMSAKPSVFVTTEDGSVYEYVDDPSSTSIETPLLPPGFVTRGKSIGGKTFHYSFSFLIPDLKTPEKITIGGMNIDCIQPHVVGENGKIIYPEKSIQLPAKTYHLDTDVTEIPEALSARRFPNLAGAELVTPDWKETIFVTDVSRNGNKIVVTFDFTNFSSHAVSPSFEGYLMGEDRLFIYPNNFEDQQANKPVEPGQTAQELTWTFTVPEDESNLVFVYIYGGRVDLNEVYRINLDQP